MLLGLSEIRGAPCSGTLGASETSGGEAFRREMNLGSDSHQLGSFVTTYGY